MNSGKIVVIGANQGALAFACFAAREGFDVTLYEAKKEQDVAYDWADDVIAAVFDRTGLPRPEQNRAFDARDTTLIPPGKGKYIHLKAPQSEVAIPVYRRELNKMLASLAKQAGAKINYECAVKSAITDNNRVYGVLLEDGTEVLSGLTVDCGGVNSAVRMSLPDSLHIPQNAKPSEMFFVRRTFFERTPGSERPIDTNKVYLKHLNERGISWCFLSHEEDTADVLVGRLDGLSDSTFTRALDDLKSENAIIGERVIKGGQQLLIPVRRPISRMFAEGYALLGDSAYMTIPLIGSGIGNGIEAGRILADVISSPRGKSFGCKNLYRYQKRYMAEIGAEHACVDMLKNWFLNSGDDDVDFLLDEGVVSDKMLQSTSGEMASITLPDILTSVYRGMKRPALMKELAGLIANIARLSKTAKNLPEQYNDGDLLLWQEKYDSAF